MSNYKMIRNLKIENVSFKYVYDLKMVKIYHQG